MQYSVIGNVNQCVVAQMTRGDEIHAEVGNLVLLSDGVTLEAAQATARINQRACATARTAGLLLEAAMDAMAANIESPIKPSAPKHSRRHAAQRRYVPTRDVCARPTICPLQPEADVYVALGLRARLICVGGRR